MSKRRGTVPNGWWPWWAENRVALEVMRRVFDHPCKFHRCPHLTVEERITLDWWYYSRFMGLLTRG